MNTETTSTFATSLLSCSESEDRSVSPGIPRPPSLVDRIANLPNELKHQVIADALCSRRCVFGVFLPEWDLCTDDPSRRALNQLYGLQQTEVYRKRDGSRVSFSEHRHYWGDFMDSRVEAEMTPVMLDVRRRYPGAFDVGFADALRRTFHVFEPRVLVPFSGGVPGPELSGQTNRRGGNGRDWDDGTPAKLPTFPLRVAVGPRCRPSTSAVGRREEGDRSGDRAGWLLLEVFPDCVETMFLDLRGCATGDVPISSVVQFARQLRGFGMSLRRLVVAGLRTGSRAFASRVGRVCHSGADTGEEGTEEKEGCLRALWGLLEPEGELVLVDQRSVWIDWDFWEQEAAAVGICPLYSSW